MTNLLPYQKKTFYFYVLHGSKPRERDFDYLHHVKQSLINRNADQLQLANDINEMQMERDDYYRLDNGIDIREYYLTGEIKEIDKEFYDILAIDDKRIMDKMSQKTKNLLTQFGYNLDGWHKPFSIEAKNKVYLKRALEAKLGFKPIIIFK